MRNLLLTGASGFIGQHLRKFLELDESFKIFAPTPIELDLTKSATIAEVVGHEKWDVVIHLAGMSHVIECEKNPTQAHAINVEGTENILRALLEQKFRGHFIFASTAQVYQAPHGDEIEKGVVFDEKRPAAPQNLYAETKRLAEVAIESASEQGLTTTVLRLFNHTHKTQAPTFFLPHIYSQLLSGATSVPVGNLDLERDIGSVHDSTRAFAAVLKSPNWSFEIFNVCSGTPKNLRRLVQQLSEKMQTPAEFIKDPARVRPHEPLRLVGSHQKLTERTGWQPEVVSEADLIKDFLCE